MYEWFALLQNLNDIELMICSRQSFTGSRLLFWFVSSFKSPIIQIQTESYSLFGGLTILILIFCLSWGSNLIKCNRNVFVLESYKAICEEAETRSCFFYIEIWVYYWFCLSPERLSYNEQPRYVTVWYCLLSISPYQNYWLD